MPLISGQKMACEPCIRGHRSTKCNHANERLMVPVRKPGRPLSACPHLPSPSCGCNSVTAAIPRKQTCHCGTSALQTPTPTPTPQDTPGIESISSSEPQSPNRSSFKIQKNGRPSSSRKQSFDPSNLARMDMNSVNILPYDQRPQVIPMSAPNGYMPVAPTNTYGYFPQYANPHSQFVSIPNQPESDLISLNGAVAQVMGSNHFVNGTSHQNGFHQISESPLTTPRYEVGDIKGPSNKTGSCCAPKTSPVAIPEPQAATNGTSCCGPKTNGHSQKSSFGSISEETPTKSSCCSSKTTQVKQESISTPTNGIMSNGISPMQHHIPAPILTGFGPGGYHQYPPQPTVFTYPPTYGSFQNPLQPLAWRQSVRANYAPFPPQLQPAGALPFNGPMIQETMNTVHTCNCGDRCQCIGCAAHPYNEASSAYVRSAFESMNSDMQQSEIYTNGQASTNGTVTTQPPNGDLVPSPTANTPSSTTSANAEEQNLSAADFFFVNYPLIGDGCGGDTHTCPCGDDCVCLGCTIHRQPAVPCGGDMDTCPCGDDCECIGCTIHNVGAIP